MKDISIEIHDKEIDDEIIIENLQENIRHRQAAGG
jgi:hypothetical protein